MPHSVIKVLKFGGTSVGSPEALIRLVNIVKGESKAGRPVVVVSALSGVTDWLVALEKSSEAQERQGIIRKIVRRHIELSRLVLSHERHAAYLEHLAEEIGGLTDLARSVAGEFRSHGIWAAGELLSAPLVASLLQQRGVLANAVNARPMIRVVRSNAGVWVVDRNQTRARTESWFAHSKGDEVPVITGYIGSTEEGKTITLGRGGSDYSAALIAEAIGASKFDRWTDVDGLYTADPNKVAGAGRFLFLLLEDATTWNEANQLGMHAHAFEPVLQACIPVHVRSTRFPQGDGTLILPARLPHRVERDARSLMAHAQKTHVSQTTAKSL